MCSPVWLTGLVSVVGLVLSALLLVPVLITLVFGGHTSSIPFLSYLKVGTLHTASSHTTREPVKKRVENSTLVGGPDRVFRHTYPLPFC